MYYHAGHFLLSGHARLLVSPPLPPQSLYTIHLVQMQLNIAKTCCVVVDSGYRSVCKAKKFDNEYGRPPLPLEGYTDLIPIVFP